MNWVITENSSMTGKDRFVFRRYI